MTVVSLDKKEVSRLRTLVDLIDGKLTIEAAATLMEVTRAPSLSVAFQRSRPKALQPWRLSNAANRANRAHGETFRETVLSLCPDRYADFGPTLAAEEAARGASLADRHRDAASMDDCRGRRDKQDENTYCHSPRKWALKIPSLAFLSVHSAGASPSGMNEPPSAPCPPCEEAAMVRLGELMMILEIASTGCLGHCHCPPNRAGPEDGAQIYRARHRGPGLRTAISRTAEQPISTFSASA